VEAFADDIAFVPFDLVNCDCLGVVVEGDFIDCFEGSCKSFAVFDFLCCEDFEFHFCLVSGCF